MVYRIGNLYYLCRSRHNVMCRIDVIAIFLFLIMFFFFKQKTAYDMRISDWSSDVCSSDLPRRIPADPRKGYLIRARLTEPGGDCIGYVIGFAYEPMIAQLAVCAQNLRLCVAAMALVVNLHAELDVAEQMVIEMQRDAFIDPLDRKSTRLNSSNECASRMP